MRGRWYFLREGLVKAVENVGQAPDGLPQLVTYLLFNNRPGETEVATDKYQITNVDQAIGVEIGCAWGGRGRYVEVSTDEGCIGQVNDQISIGITCLKDVRSQIVAKTIIGDGSWVLQRQITGSSGLYDVVARWDVGELEAAV